MYTQCFPSVCGKNFTGDSGGIRTQDLLLTSADVLTSRPPSLPDDDRPARILYSSGFRDIHRLMKFLRRVINLTFVYMYSLPEVCYLHEVCHLCTHLDHGIVLPRTMDLGYSWHFVLQTDTQVSKRSSAVWETYQRVRELYLTHAPRRLSNVPIVRPMDGSCASGLRLQLFL